MAPATDRVGGAGSADNGVSVTNQELAALRNFWDMKRGGRIAPARADIDVFELRPWLGHLMILDVIDGGADFRYRLYGTGLVNIFGFDLTGLRVSEAGGRIGDRPLEEYRAVARRCVPSFVSRMSPSSREYLKVDKLALPLVENGVVTKILGAIYLSENQS